MRSQMEKTTKLSLCFALVFGLAFASVTPTEAGILSWLRNKPAVQTQSLNVAIGGAGDGKVALSTSQNDGLGGYLCNGGVCPGTSQASSIVIDNQGNSHHDHHHHHDQHNDHNLASVAESLREMVKNSERRETDLKISSLQEYLAGLAQQMNSVAIGNAHHGHHSSGNERDQLNDVKEYLSELTRLIQNMGNNKDDKIENLMRNVEQINRQVTNISERYGQERETININN